MSDSDISLGAVVQDKISGFTGVVVSVGTHISGCERYGVRALGEESTDRRSDEEFFFAAQLEVEQTADEGPFPEEAERAQTAEDCDLILGNTVHVPLTNVRGFATTITYNLFNCPRVAITPHNSDSDEQPDREWEDLPMVEKVGDGASEDYEETIEDENTESTGAAEDIQRKQDLG